MRVAKVIGPIEGSRPPVGVPRRDLAASGYSCAEYFLEGTTVAYRHLDALLPGRDGRWQSEEAGEADYRTRLLVVRPVEPADFNGTVLLNWQNVSAGFELGGPQDDEFYRGYAWVGVSAQEVGLYGSPWGATVRRRSGPGRGLVDADPERYADLFHPGDAGSFEIFGQAATAVGPRRPGSPDPLAGLDVRRVIAVGGSQSAMRLVSYANGVHAAHHAVDGFVLSVWEGRAPLLGDGPVATGRRTALRPDLDVPVLVMNSEFEVMADAATDMPDSDRLRVWEVTGTPHGTRRRKLPPSESGWSTNPLSTAPVQQAAIRGMHEWLTSGTAPRSLPRVEREGGPTGPILRDDDGNARGGIRLPELAAPLGQYRGMSQRTGQGGLFGGYRPFDQERLAQLYPNREAYLQRWDDAVSTLVGDGALLPDDAETYRERGRTVATALPAD